MKEINQSNREKLNSTPWLLEDGTVKSHNEIKSICHCWTPLIWEKYLQEIVEVKQNSNEILSDRKWFDSLPDAFTLGDLFSNNAEIEYPNVKKLLEILIKLLSPREYKTIQGLFYDNLSERYLSQKMRISRSTLKIYKKRAIKKLKKLILFEVPRDETQESKKLIQELQSIEMV